MSSNTEGVTVATTATILSNKQSNMDVEATYIAEVNERTAFGFWLYLMTDCVLFASLFAVFAVLHGNTNGGPDAASLFSLPYALSETLILLTSSFVCGLSVIALQRRSKALLLTGLGVVFCLGAAFLTLEFREFHHLPAEGHSWRQSGFLSAFFTLVGTHGLHITAGLIWLVVVVRQFLAKGWTESIMRKLRLFSMFWHFLDVVWIFIFSVVYLLGAIR